MYSPVLQPEGGGVLLGFGDFLTCGCGVRERGGVSQGRLIAGGPEHWCSGSSFSSFGDKGPFAAFTTRPSETKDQFDGVGMSIASLKAAFKARQRVPCHGGKLGLKRGAQFHEHAFGQDFGHQLEDERLHFLLLF